MKRPSTLKILILRPFSNGLKPCYCYRNTTLVDCMPNPAGIWSWKRKLAGATGWIETPQADIVAFSLNMQMQNHMKPAIRLDILQQALAELGLYPKADQEGK